MVEKNFAKIDIPIYLGYYYKDEEKTNEVIDENGWFHTGDIGVLIEDKFLRITDRKKEIFKTSTGKYVAPQVIENLFKESPFIFYFSFFKAFTMLVVTKCINCIFFIKEILIFAIHF